MHFWRDIKHHMMRIWKKKCSLTLKKVWVQGGFWYIFLCYGKSIGKTMHFSCDEINHMMGIWWKKSYLNSVEVWYQFRRLSQFGGFCCNFLCYRKLMGKLLHLMKYTIYRMGIGWEKSIHTMGKVWVAISAVLPMRWVLLHFPILWEIDGETHAFPIWWDSLIFYCVTCKRWRKMKI